MIGKELRIVVCSLHHILIGNINEGNTARTGEIRRGIIDVDKFLLISRWRLQEGVATGTIWLVGSLFKRDKIDVLTGVFTVIKGEGGCIRIHIAG